MNSTPTDTTLLGTANTWGIRQPGTELADEYRALGHWRDMTILDDILSMARTYPRRAAIVAYRTGFPVPETITYGQLAALVERAALALIELGVEPNDVVSLQMPNGWEFAVAALAAARAGAVVNPLVTIFRRRELEFMLSRAGSKVLIVEESFRGFNHAELALELRSTLPALEHVVVARGAADGGALSFEQHFLHNEAPLGDAAAVLADRRRGCDDMASLIYTSGTTGEPKGTLHSYNTLWSAGRAVFENLSLSSDDVSFMASPMGHLTGYLWGMLQPLSRGMTAVFQDVWNPGGFLDLIDVEGVTWTIGATPFVVDAVEEQVRRPRSFSSLRTFVCAGAPISPTLPPQAASELGAQLLAQWGTSECGGVTVHHPSDDVDTVASSDGRPIDFMALKLLDEAGNAVAPGTEGRLFVRGPSVFVGYLGRGDLYDEVVGPDGWFDTGDLGIERPDGTVRITGRAKDIIIRGGENIPVVEIENLLMTHPGVREVAVIGIPDDRLGERGCAVIVPVHEAPGLPDLLSHLAEHGTAKQYWPEHLLVVDEMPRTPSGKIQKFLLRERAAGRVAR